jgi:hypothetical protein
MQNPNIYAITPNPIIPIDMSYVGLNYAVTGLGGFIMEEGVKTVTMIPINQINQYDVTNSVQIKFDVRTFNEKLGLYKDPSNVNIITSSWDNTTGNFPMDTITLTSPDFVEGVYAQNIISVGSLQTAYSDFILYVNDYFGYANGFSTLFTTSSLFDINNGVFDASAFVHIINGQTLNPTTGEYVNDLSGSVTVNYINNIIDYICYANPFNNRPTTGNNGAGYTIQDGFIDGDLIYIPTGITFTMNLNINNNDIYLNYLGENHLTQLTSQTNYTNGYFSVNTQATQTNIRRTVKAPLLLRLTNLS